VTELVRRAEQAGLVERRASDDDRRVSFLGVTAEGEARLMRTFNALRDDRQALAAVFSELRLRFRAASV
jgi:DNA-binding MarR family transcriptional regulator